MTAQYIYNIPPAELQVDFSALLISAQGRMLQQALLETVGSSNIKIIDEEAHCYVSEQSLQKLAGQGVRAEIFFALPSILKANPHLLGYYRLLLGFSRKQFYSNRFGLGSAAYSNMEDKGTLHAELTSKLSALCHALNSSAEYLVKNLPEIYITQAHVEKLTLLTYGPQLRGGHNVAIGVNAVEKVFTIIRDIVGEHAEKVSDHSIILKDATGRIVRIKFGSDPDVEVVSMSDPPRTNKPLLAIEVKGGRDISNAHNRLGEAEKSHLKVKESGFNDRWTIVNVEGLPKKARERGSPNTTAFYDLEDLILRKGRAYEEFRDSLLQKLRLPDKDRE